MEIFKLMCFETFQISCLQTQPDRGTSVANAATVGHRGHCAPQSVSHAPATDLVLPQQVQEAGRYLQQPRPATLGSSQHSLPEAAASVVQRR